jgi:hypothetical protein
LFLKFESHNNYRKQLDYLRHIIISLANIDD